MRRPLYTAFARWYGAQLDEAELAPEDYPSFGSFFARRLRPGSRTLPSDPDAVIAPCDGALAARGEADGETMIQAKGHDYSLVDLVVDAELGERLENGTYLTYYLSPKDYHRVHAPLAGAVLGYRYVPGTLFPVSPRFADEIDGLFVRNERVVIEMDTARGPVAVVMVGATGVGNMELTYLPGEPVESRAFRGKGPVRVRHESPVAVARGDELGAFHLGSTVVVIFSPGSASLEDDLDVGDPIRFGRTVARRRAGGSSAATRAVGITR
jgi:phosphatidylserine decarboxylase